MLFFEGWNFRSSPPPPTTHPQMAMVSMMNGIQAPTSTTGSLFQVSLLNPSVNHELAVYSQDYYFCTFTCLEVDDISSVQFKAMPFIKPISKSD